MDCRAMFARLSEFVDGELPSTQCEEIEAHVRGCTPCEGFVRTLRRTVALCQRLPATPLPDAMRQELRSLLERESRRWPAPADRRSTEEGREPS